MNVLPRTRCDTQYRFAEPGPSHPLAVLAVPATRSGIRMPHRARDTEEFAAYFVSGQPLSAAVG
jgi:hypothetical protein